MVAKGSYKFKKSYWSGKKVLVTGHTGFKGSWLTIWLNQLGCDVVGISLEPQTVPSLFEITNTAKQCASHIIDIGDLEAINSVVEGEKPEVVFHLAAQALVYQSYEKPLDTFSTNVMGTVNLLESLRLVGSSSSVVMVTSDKVYRNDGTSQPYVESDALGGKDPYSASKAAAELIIASYRHAFLEEHGVAIATARAGNVIGGGDWASSRLIPDAIRAWSNNQSLEVRNPHSIRPWQHVLEPLYGYLLLAQKLALNPSAAGAYNFGPNAESSHSVGDVIELAKGKWSGTTNKTVRTDGRYKESDWLLVDSSKSKSELGFMPMWSTEQAVERTINWYRQYIQGSEPLELCINDIKKYEELLGLRNDK